MRESGTWTRNTGKLCYQENSNMILLIINLRFKNGFSKMYLIIEELVLSWMENLMSVKKHSESHNSLCFKITNIHKQNSHFSY